MGENKMGEDKYYAYDGYVYYAVPCGYGACLRSNCDIAKLTKTARHICVRHEREDYRCPVQHTMKTMCSYEDIALIVDMINGETEDKGAIIL